MSEAIGPGDWVECVDDSPTRGGDAHNLLLGSPYIVLRTGIGQLHGEPICNVSSANGLATGNEISGVRLSRFRLKQPDYEVTIAQEVAE